jgi:hypothetical protein
VKSKSTIRVAKSLLVQTSRIWRIALSDDDKAVRIPVDDTYDEDVIRCSLYVAQSLIRNRREDLKAVNYPINTCLLMLRLAFQLEMPAVHEWVLTRLQPQSSWPLADTLDLYFSDLHDLKDDVFSPLTTSSTEKCSSSLLRKKCITLMTTKGHEIVEHALALESITEERRLWLHLALEVHAVYFIRRMREEWDSSLSAALKRQEMLREIHFLW